MTIFLAGTSHWFKALLVPNARNTFEFIKDIAAMIHVVLFHLGGLSSILQLTLL